MFGRGEKTVIVEVPVDSTGWLIDNDFAEFILMHSIEIRFMCMLGYAFYAGNKVYASAKGTSTAYKFISMIFMCTGGGILVPIFINKIPVPLANDGFIIAILLSFMIHQYCPVLREVYDLSPIFKTIVVVPFEIVRAFVVCGLTSAAASSIPASVHSFPIFGPIMCGAVGGCGAAFFPMSKGLDPIKGGMSSTMFTALTAAAAYHIYLSTPLSDGCIDAQKKAQLHVALYFISSGLANAFQFMKEPAVKKID